MLVVVVDECPVANDKSDQVRSDVLFLIDASHNISKIQFQKAVKLIMDTVDQFQNIGPNGIQVRLDTTKNYLIYIIIELFTV